MTKKNDIEFLRVKYLRGPNIWTYRPVMEVWLDIGELEDFPSNTLPGFFERLTAVLPGLIEHRCGVGERGGFLERLREGTWAGHILEHVVLELQNLCGMRTGFGKTRSTGERGIYKMAFRSRQESVSRAALDLGRELLMAAINDTPFTLEPKLEQLRELADACFLGPSTGNIVEAAIERNIPFIRLTDGNLVQLGYGAAQRRIWTAETDRTSAIAEGIASDKDLTKTLLSSCGVPVPEGRMVESPEDAWESAQDIGLPVVVKPYDGNHGRGVSLNLTTEQDVTAAYHLANRKGNGVIVEKYITGNEHRLLIVGKRMVAAARGESLWLIGNGQSTIDELADLQINTDPRRGVGEEFPLNSIMPSESGEIILELQRQNLTPASIPAAGQKVLIQHNGNVAIDVTDEVHPDVAELAALAARVVGLDIAGIDLVAEDISRPLEEQGGAIIEVNSSPGLLSHLKPEQGQPRPVGRAIIDYLFASEETGRIPIVGVAGKEGASLVTRLIANLVHIGGKQVGAVCSDGLYLNQRQVSKGNTVDWDTSQRLLLNRAVQAAVFQADARMILGDGLAYDKCDVGVVIDLDDYSSLSEFYIREREQMPNVMRSQIDIVLPSGHAVLNADIPEVADLSEYCDGSVIFYSLDADLPIIQSHRSKGERVVFLRDNCIVLANGAVETALLSLSSLKPRKQTQAATMMAAVAAAWALNLSPELIGAGLRTFDSTAKTGNF